MRTPLLLALVLGCMLEAHAFQPPCNVTRGIYCDPGAAISVSGDVTYINVDPTSVPDLSGVRWTVVQNQSGMTFSPDPTSGAPTRWPARSSRHSRAASLRSTPNCRAAAGRAAA